MLLYGVFYFIEFLYIFNYSIIFPLKSFIPLSPASNQQWRLLQKAKVAPYLHQAKAIQSTTQQSKAQHSTATQASKKNSTALLSKANYSTKQSKASHSKEKQTIALSKAKGKKNK